jgi:hypothetical protein
MLNFIDQLDEEQAANAEKVARAAKRAGVDPVLAVAIAFQESKLRSNPPRGSSGEIGIMQVMPGTGKGMGFNEKQLGNLEQNIEAGIRYLKKGLEATGNDPQLTAIYYNGGPGAIQAMTSGKEPDPRVFDYLRSVNSYGAFAPKPEQPAKSEGDMVLGENPPPPPPAPPGTDISGATPGERFLYGGAGALAGSASLAGQGWMATRASNAARRAGLEEAARLAEQRKAGVLPSGAPAAGAPAGAPAGVPAAAPAGAAPPGATQAAQGSLYRPRGTQGSGTFNYGIQAGLTPIEAGRALDTTKEAGGVHNLLTQRRESTNLIRQQFPSETWVENPRFGGLVTQEGRAPRASFVQQPSAPTPGAAPVSVLQQLPSKQPVPTTPPPPTMLQQAKSGLTAVTEKLGSLARPVISGAKYVAPPLAGLGAGMELAELEHEYRKPEDQRDYTKMALSGIAGISGGLSLIPPFTLPAAAVSGGASLLNYLREKGKQERQQAQSLDYAAP